MVDFGECLKRAQKEKNVPSVELARRLGVHKQQVSIWRGKKNVRLDTLIRVCEALKIDVGDFLY
jgi:DNA-binding Xre family transcriptional regulator